MFSEFPVDFWLALMLAAAAGWAAGHVWRSLGRAKSTLRSERMSPQYFAGLNHLLNEQQDKALEVLRGLAEADTETVETQLALGHLYRRRGEVDRAIHVHEAIMQRPELPALLHQQAQFALGEDYLKAGLLDRAEVCFQKLIDQPAHRTASLRNLLNIYEQQGDWLQAINAYQQLSSFSSPEHPTALAHYYCELAEQAQREGMFSQAMENLNRAFEVQRNFPRGNLINADFYLAAGDARSAAAVCKRVMEIHPHLLPIVLPLFIRGIRALNMSLDNADAQLSLLSADSKQRAALAYAAIVSNVFDEPYLLQCLPDFLRQDATLGEMVQALVADANSLNSVQLHSVATSLAKVFRRTQRYRCISCGVNTGSHFWQCPGCHSWDTLAPVSRLELSPVSRRG